MRLKGWWRKAVALGLAGVMLTGGAVSAAPTYYEETDTAAAEHPDHGYDFDCTATKYEIDPHHRGVLHIHKSAVAEGGVARLGDVTYTIYRAADIVQGHLDGKGKQVSLEYRSLMRDSTEAERIIAIPGGLTSSQELGQWVEELLNGDDPSKRVSNLSELPHWSATTDANGNVTFDGDGAGLPLGLYIVYESSYPSRITEAQPFVVSIPTTSVDDGNNDTKWPGETDGLAGDNVEGSAGVYWVYDIQAHPKNAVKDLTVEKHLVADAGAATAYERQEGVNDPSNDVLTDAEDYEMGDTIRCWIRAEVPKSIGDLEIYYLLDRMSVGQTFTNDVDSGNQVARMEVWGRSPEGEMVYIPRCSGGTENYRVVSAEERENITNTENFTDFYGNSMSIRAEGQPKAYAHENAFAVLFNTQSLSKDLAGDGTTRRGPRYSEVYVTYDVTLNEKALVGAPGNVNDVALVLSHCITDPQVGVSDEVHEPKQDEFEPFRNPDALNLDVINPQCIDTRVYTYALRVTKIGEGTDNMEGVTFELRDSQGEAIAVSQYTEADRAALAVDDVTGRIGDYYVNPEAESPSAITIDADQEVYLYGLKTGTYQLVETKTRDGYQLLSRPIVLTITSDSAVYAKPMNYCTDPAGDYRWTDSESLTYSSNYGMEKAVAAIDGPFDGARGMYQDGLFALTVLNRHGFNIPATGGHGMARYIVSGTGIAAVGVVGVLLGRKRKRNEDAA